MFWACASCWLWVDSFSTYSSFPERVTTFKELYYMISAFDFRESKQERQVRREGMHCFLIPFLLVTAWCKINRLWNFKLSIHNFISGFFLFIFPCSLFHNCDFTLVWLVALFLQFKPTNCCIPRIQRVLISHLRLSAASLSM
jgi:hypothetical protein